MKASIFSFSSEVSSTVSLSVTCLLFISIPLHTLSRLFWVLAFFFFFPFLNSFLMNVDFFLLAKDLKVWRTDPGSIFDLDPLEDNIQSRSLHMLSGITHFLVHPIYVVLSQK